MLLKKTKLLAILFLIPFLLTKPVSASENAFVTLVNPVRGHDFWPLENQEPLTAVKEQLKAIEAQDFKATWLLRPDLIFEKELAEYFQTFPPGHEIGLFLEVTPAWAQKVKVEYHQQPLWHWANSVFLSGYTVAEREKLIDVAFAEFKNIFGRYPQSVGAWHLDAGSLEYMEDNYGLQAALICADQFGTDNYQIWGGWWGVPYYPSRFNVLTPAQTEKNKLNLVVFQWAARDPVNGYGGGGFESSFSVQPNDYVPHDLDTDYFSNLIDIYTRPAQAPFGQLTLGLENDFLWPVVGPEYQNQLIALAKKNLPTLTLGEFSQWYQDHFPQLSPPHQIEAKDPLGSDQKAIWLMSVTGRIGLIEKEGKTFIRDWRVYHEKWAEPYLQVANTNRDLKLSLPAKIDTIRFPQQEQELSGSPEKLLAQKTTLPFATPKMIFVLMSLIILGFLFWGFRLNKWLLPIITFGIFTQAITMVKSGLLYSYGLGFWGPNGHDGIWHLSLIQALTRHFPPQNPIFAGENLSNYHYLFDLLVALVHKLTTLPALNLYFQVFPLIFSSLLGILTYLLVKKLTSNKLGPLLAVFLVYFGGNWGWLVSLIRGQGIGGESMFWANQAVSFLINPPFALSIILILLGLNLYFVYLKKFNPKLLIILSLIFGLLIGVKAYAGIVVLFGLAAASFWQWHQEKKLTSFCLFFLSLLVSLIVFLPANKTASSLFVFSPLWFIHTMFAFGDRFYWVRLDQARQAYLATGKWGKWFLAEGLGLAIFFIGNLGTRIFALGKIISWLKNFRKINSFQILFLGCLAASAFIPLLVIQKGNPWNSIQFFYYFLFFSAILAGWWLGEFKGKFKPILLLGLVIFTIPTTLGTLKHYLPYRAPARIGFDELEALEFLKNQPEGVILTFPHDSSLREKIEAPKPLYAYETTGYVSAFSNKNPFLEDEMNLEIMQVNWRPRRQQAEEFFQTDDFDWAGQFLQENQIRYLYLVGNQSFSPEFLKLELEKIFENGEVKVYQFND